jgi:hypothetical protein
LHPRIRAGDCRHGLLLESGQARRRVEGLDDVRAKDRPHAVARDARIDAGARWGLENGELLIEGYSLERSGVFDSGRGVVVVDVHNAPFVRRVFVMTDRSVEVTDGVMIVMVVVVIIIVVVGVVRVPCNRGDVKVAALGYPLCRDGEALDR